jgi:hypothetical protein
MPKLALAALTAMLSLPACIHATGHLPSGPPPEYEETPPPKGMATDTSPPPVAALSPVAPLAPASTGAPLPSPVSAPPGH